MRRRVLLLFMASVLLLFAAQADAHQTGPGTLGSGSQFMATGSGGQQVTDPVGGVQTDGTCALHLRIMDRDMQQLEYAVECFNVTGVTQAHLHVGNPQQNGDIGAFLFGPADPSGPINGLVAQGTLTNNTLVNDLQGMGISDLVQLMQQDQIYLNVHTMDNPTGEVRGPVAFLSRRVIHGGRSDHLE